MEKKEYTAPELVVLGKVQEITQGDGWFGDDDTWNISIWGFNIPINFGKTGS